MLKLKPGYTLNKGVTTSIVSLVARSVEGLAPERVTLVDTSGRVLSDARGAESEAVPSTQLEYRRELEAHLASKAEDMLSQHLGSGRAVVRVTADVDFKRIREKSETYRPEDKVITSEKVTTSKSTTPAPGVRGLAGTASNLKLTPSVTTADAAGKTQEETVQTDYAVSKTVRELEDRIGTIARLTVAAMVDLSPRSEGSDADGRRLTLDAAQDIIKQAVGFKRDRDDIKVTEVRLAGPAEGAEAEAQEMQRWQYYLSLVRNASLGVAAVIALLLGLLFLRRLRQLPPPVVAPPPAEPPLLDQLASLARRDPAAVAQALDRMLREPEPSTQVPV